MCAMWFFSVLQNIVMSCMHPAAISTFPRQSRVDNLLECCWHYFEVERIFDKLIESVLLYKLRHFAPLLANVDFPVPGAGVEWRKHSHLAETVNELVNFWGEVESLTVTLFCAGYLQSLDEPFSLSKYIIWLDHSYFHRFGDFYTSHPAYFICRNCPFS